jgi:hypothetical protein
MKEEDLSASGIGLRVFLCHSSRDKPAVRDLYNKLKRDGFKPWLDEVNLLPGQDWDRTIRAAVRGSDIVVVCMSPSSITKEGYIQKEIRLVLDVADEKPDGRVFIIPACLEPCEVPERLSRWQWVNLFEAKGYERLVAGLYSQFRGQLLDGFIHSRGAKRSRFGRWLVCGSADGDAMVTPTNAEATIESANEGLSSEDQAERVWTALNLMNRFYLTNGKLGFLTRRQQDRLCATLWRALDRGEATQSAAMWALLWLTGARNRGQAKFVEAEYVFVEPPMVSRIEALLQTPDLDTNTFSCGCLILTRERGVHPVVHQVDWIFESACIADGAKPRRDLPVPSPTYRRASTNWMKHLLGASLPLEKSCRIAQALGAFGEYLPEMVEPLRFMLTSEKYSDEERDEALVYLAFIRTPSVIPILMRAADSLAGEGNEYLHGRGVLGLLLLDDVEGLLHQMRKDLPQGDLSAYAYGLAGSRDPRGRVALEQFRGNGSPQIRGIAGRALGRW